MLGEVEALGKICRPCFEAERAIAERQCRFRRVFAARVVQVRWARRWPRGAPRVPLRDPAPLRAGRRAGGAQEGVDEIGPPKNPVVSIY